MVFYKAIKEERKSPLLQFSAYYTEIFNTLTVDYIILSISVYSTEKYFFGLKCFVLFFCFFYEYYFSKKKYTKIAVITKKWKKFNINLMATII